MFDVLHMACKIKVDIDTKQLCDEGEIRVARGSVVAVVPWMRVVFYPVVVFLQPSASQALAVKSNRRRQHIGGLQRGAHFAGLEFAQRVHFAAKAVPETTHSPSAQPTPATQTTRPLHFLHLPDNLLGRIWSAVFKQFDFNKYQLLYLRAEGRVYSRGHVLISSFTTGRTSRDRA